MKRKFGVTIFFLLTTVLSLVFAQSSIEKAKPLKNSILIVKDSSKLEISVFRIIRDTLTRKGYVVKEASLADVKKEKASLYNVSIIFNAIKAGKEIDPRVQNFITTKSDTLSKVFLFTVYGNTFNIKEESVDAITQATQALQPQLIANHILRSLRL